MITVDIILSLLEAPIKYDHENQDVSKKAFLLARNLRIKDSHKY